MDFPPFNGLRRAAAAAAGALVLQMAPLAAQEAPREITHELGVTRIEGVPQRVVALEFSFVQALDVLGEAAIGIADDNQPERIEQLLGKVVSYDSVGTRLEPNLELISALAPDLIIADERRHAAIYDQLTAIAPTIVLNSWDGSYQDIKDAVVTIAETMGERENGLAAVAAHEAVIADIAAQIPDDDNRRFLLAVATADSWSLHTSASFSGSIFQAIGVTPAVEGDVPVESAVGLERLVAVNPDVLLVATDPGPTIHDAMAGNAAWEAIAAVEAGMVFPVDRNQYARFRDLRTAELIATDILNNVFSAD